MTGNIPWVVTQSAPSAAARTGSLRRAGKSQGGQPIGRLGKRGWNVDAQPVTLSNIILERFPCTTVNGGRRTVVIRIIDGIPEVATAMAAAVVARMVVAVELVGS